MGSRVGSRVSQVIETIMEGAGDLKVKAEDLKAVQMAKINAHRVALMGGETSHITIHT